MVLLVVLMQVVVVVGDRLLSPMLVDKWLQLVVLQLLFLVMHTAACGGWRQIAHVVGVDGQRVVGGGCALASGTLAASSVKSRPQHVVADKLDMLLMVLLMVSSTLQ
jgi:hypothetical protein